MMSFLIPMEALAETPYNGYIWNTEGRDVESINGYEFDNSIDGSYLSAGPFQSPEDIFIAEDDSVYIVDTGNNRIVHLNKNHQLVNVIGNNQGSGKLNGPKGVYVKNDGTIYVADTQNQRIAIFGSDGKFIKELTAPKSPLLGAKFTYSPSKLVIDKRGYLYVLNEGSTKGLMQIDENGEFKGYFGANPVGFSWSRLVTKLIATKEQKAKMETVKPLAFSNLDQDQEGFIYTTTLGEEINQIKRLSPVGVDTLNPSPKQYGDLVEYGSNIEIPAFIDLTVDKDGLITGLNLQTSKIYQYDKLGNLLFIFGGLGQQNGVFITPSSIDKNSKGNMYVVDKGRNRVDIFRTTPFADLVHKASKLYVDGQYEEASNLWKQVININGNYDIAYYAIGKALYKSEKYKEAMTYFSAANARPDYSQAFQQYRIEWTREHFSWIFGGIIFLFLLFRYGIRMIKKLISRTRKSNQQPILEQNVLVSRQQVAVDRESETH
jgi:DNA-binding beta-propeller fold protein YncE